MATNNSGKNKNKKSFPNPKAKEFIPKKNKKPFPNTTAEEYIPKRNSKEYEKTKNAINNTLKRLESILRDGKTSLINYKNLSQRFVKEKDDRISSLKKVIKTGKEIEKNIANAEKNNKKVSSLKGKLLFQKKAFDRIQKDYVDLEKEFLQRKTKMEENKIKLYDELLQTQKEFKKHFNHKINDTYVLPFSVRTILKERYDTIIDKHKGIISHIKSGLLRREAREIVNEGNKELNSLRKAMNVSLRAANMEKHIKKIKRKD